MESLAFVLPLLPGKTDQDRQAMHSCWTGERKAQFAEARKRVGITREAVYIQQTPDGEVVVVYVEGQDLASAFKEIATAGDPLNRWFRDHVREVHGVALEDGFPPPEQILDFRG